MANTGLPETFSGNTVELDYHSILVIQWNLSDKYLITDFPVEMQ